MAQSTAASDQRQNCAIGLAVRAQQIPGDDRRLADPQRQALRFHAVLHAEDALLEQLALRPVRFLGGVGRDGAGLLGEREIGIAGPVGRLHRAIAGQRGGDSEFLLRPVDIGDAVAGGGLIRPRSQTLGPKMNFVLLG